MKRLRDDALSADAARILRSAESDAPSSPDVQQARIIEAYGVASPSLLASGSALDALRRRKWTVLAGTFVVVSAAIVAWPRAIAERAPAPARSAAIAAISPVPPPPRASEPSVRVEDLPAAPAVVVPAPRPMPSVAIAVADELSAIDGARAALRRGRPDETLTRVAACRAEFPHPRYAEEADALEVQALAALGRHDEARAKAALFFRAHPDSPYEQRIRAAITEAQP